MLRFLAVGCLAPWIVVFVVWEWKGSNCILSKPAFVVPWHKWQAGKARSCLPHFTECDRIRRQFLQRQANIISTSSICLFWILPVIYAAWLKAGQQNNVNNNPYNLRLRARTCCLRFMCNSWLAFVSRWIQILIEKVRSWIKSLTVILQKIFVNMNHSAVCFRVSGARSQSSILPAVRQWCTFKWKWKQHSKKHLFDVAHENVIGLGLISFLLSARVLPASYR